MVTEGSVWTVEEDKISKDPAGEDEKIIPVVPVLGPQVVEESCECSQTQNQKHI